MEAFEWLNEWCHTNQNRERAVGMEAYMKNRFTFYGISASEREDGFKIFLSNFPTWNPLTLNQFADVCWKDSHRELHYFALNLWRKKQKLLTVDFLHEYEEKVITNSWWDSVDVLAVHILGFVVKGLPKEDIKSIAFRWGEHENMWLNRCSLIFQLTYKDQTDTDLLWDLILAMSSEKEFFIRKAIGWALREYSKTNPVWVRYFIEAHQSCLSGLSIREGSKYIGG